MFILMLIVFIVGYGFIVFEHVNHINKAGTALFIGSLTWAIYAIGGEKILDLGYSSAWNDIAHEIGAVHDVREFITHHQLCLNDFKC